MEETIAQKSFFEALNAMVREAYLGPADPRGTWFVDNEADSGFVGILDRVNAAEASRVHGYPNGSSMASHAFHIRFALDLTIRAARGEPAYENAKWSESWTRNSVTTEEWAGLRKEIRQQIEDMTATLAAGPQWNDPQMVTGAIATVAHGAWHLGAVRQLLAHTK